MVHASIAAVTIYPSKEDGGACQHFAPLNGSRSLVEGRKGKWARPPHLARLYGESPLLRRATSRTLGHGGVRCLHQ
jgi:hypothetical protein